MSRIASRLFLVSIVLLLFLGCAPRRIEVPTYEGVDVRTVLASKDNISGIEATFSIIFQKDDTDIKGDGALDIAKNGDMRMRIYSFGFLAFELISESGLIKSKPFVESNRATILTYGLRDCLFWWDMDDFTVEETESNYVLSNFYRTVWMDKKTMFPLKQVIALEDGRELTVSYEEPETNGETWYPAKMRIGLSRYSVTLRIKEITYISGA